MPRISPIDVGQLTLCDALDRILNKGAVICGEIKISVSNVDLIYLGLQVVLSSVAGLRESGSHAEKQELHCRTDRHAVSNTTSHVNDWGSTQ